MEPPFNPPSGFTASPRNAALSEAEQWAVQVAKHGRRGPYLADRQPPPGPAFSVETMTREGMHEVVAISRITHEPSRGTTRPAELAKTEAAQVRSLVRALLDLAGHEAGRATTHVVLTTTGPHIVSCTFDRDRGES